MMDHEQINRLGDELYAALRSQKTLAPLTVKKLSEVIKYSAAAQAAINRNEIQRAPKPTLGI